MSVLVNRLIDVKVAARRAAEALDNVFGGTWEKFLSGGVDDIDAEDQTLTKPSDVPVFDPEQVEVLFDREAFGQAYKDSIDNEGSTADTMRAKQSSDMLSSMQQAEILRYSSTRIRHFCASRSRRQSIAAADAEIIQLEIQS